MITKKHPETNIAKAAVKGVAKGAASNSGIVGATTRAAKAGVSGVKGAGNIIKQVKINQSTRTPLTQKEKALQKEAQNVHKMANKARVNELKNNLKEKKEQEKFNKRVATQDKKISNAYTTKKLDQLNKQGIYNPVSSTVPNKDINQNYKTGEYVSGFNGYKHFKTIKDPRTGTVTVKDVTFPDKYNHFFKPNSGKVKEMNPRPGYSFRKIVKKR